MRTNSSRCVSHLISSHGSSILIHSDDAENAYVGVDCRLRNYGNHHCMCLQIPHNSCDWSRIGAKRHCNRCICTCCDPGILTIVCVSVDYSGADSLYAAFLYLVIFGVCHICWMIIRAFTLTSIVVSDFGSSRRCVWFKDPIYMEVWLSVETQTETQSSSYRDPSSLPCDWCSCPGKLLWPQFLNWMPKEWLMAFLSHCFLFYLWNLAKV